MADLRWILNRSQDWVDYVNEDGVLLGSISRDYRKFRVWAAG